jgi:hypothetical protein
MNTTTRLHPARQDLAPGALLSLSAVRGLEIEVRAGRIWLTEEGDGDDHFVAAGQRHCIRGDGRVVIEVDGPLTVLLQFHAALAAAGAVPAAALSAAA